MERHQLHLEAREALFDTLHECGFQEELEAFAVEHTPRASELPEARRDEEYAKALRWFGDSWGLHSEWFLGHCHDMAWRLTHDNPSRTYGHPWPSPYARLLLRLRFDEGQDQRGRPLVPQSETDRQWMFALWTDDTKREVRQKVILAFDQFWKDVIEPQRRARGGPQRRRPLQETQRDARAFVTRAILKRGRKRTPKANLLNDILCALAKRWPNEGYDALDSDTLAKALDKFGKRIRKELP